MHLSGPDKDWQALGQDRALQTWLVSTAVAQAATYQLQTHRDSVLRCMASSQQDEAYPQNVAMADVNTTASDVMPCACALQVAAAGGQEVDPDHAPRHSTLPLHAAAGSSPGPPSC